METKLNLVNHLLQVVGERKVLSLDTGHPSVVQAEQALDSADLDFQGKGWWFNTNNAQTLAQNNRGEIILPAECLAFSIAPYKQAMNTMVNKTRYVRRGGRVYDSWANTFVLNRDLVADLVVRIAIEDLPPTASSYLKHYAAERYYVDDDGDAQKARALAERVGLAWAFLQAEVLRNTDVNRNDSPAVQEVMYRSWGTGNSYNPMLPGGRFR